MARAGIAKIFQCHEGSRYFASNKELPPMKHILLPLLVCLFCVGEALGDTLTCGSADDTSSIGGTLLAVCRAGGGEIIVPPGTCLLVPASGLLPLTLCSNLTIRGAGRKSVLKIKDSNNPVAYLSIFGAQTSVSNVAFKDFAIDQNPNGYRVSPGLEQLHVINLSVTTLTPVTGLSVS